MHTTTFKDLSKPIECRTGSKSRHGAQNNSSLAGVVGGVAPRLPRLGVQVVGGRGPPRDSGNGTAVRRRHRERADAATPPRPAYWVSRDRPYEARMITMPAI